MLVYQVLNQCPADPYCLKCLNNKCKLCYNSFIYITGVCTVAADIYKNCSFFDKVGRCFLCKNNYYYDNVKFTCLKIPSKYTNCLTYDKSSDKCLTCDNQILVTDGICTGQAKCPDSNCQICNSDGLCLTCNSKYSFDMTDGTCKPETRITLNCNSYGSLGCQFCRIGYFDKNGVCTSTNVQN